MRISKDETIAGYSALTVRAFLLRNGEFMNAGIVARGLGVNEQQAQKFLHDIESLGLVEPAQQPPSGSEVVYETTIKGYVLANATAAKPIRRSTAELALRQFMERLIRVNANRDYVYSVKSAVVFGSMLTNIERLGDVDIGIELESKFADKAELHCRCEARRKLAMKRGTVLRSANDYESWPRTEVLRALRARLRSLSLHSWEQVVNLPKLRYRILCGDRERIVGMISRGTCVDA